MRLVPGQRAPRALALPFTANAKNSTSSLLIADLALCLASLKAKVIAVVNTNAAAGYYSPALKSE